VFPLNLYARVRISCDAQLHTRPRVQRAPGLPCALLLLGANDLQTSDKACRENEKSYSVVIARLDRATQYSRALMMNKNALEYCVTRFRG
jgi:hypothetical protein